MNTNEDYPEFKTYLEAKEWMVAKINDSNNFRFFYVNRLTETERILADEYEESYKNGCCGYFDIMVIVNNRLAWIGCNYGHID